MDFEYDEKSRTIRFTNSNNGQFLLIAALRGMLMMAKKGISTKDCVEEIEKQLKIARQDYEYLARAADCSTKTAH